MPDRLDHAVTIGHGLKAPAVRRDAKYAFVEVDVGHGHAGTEPPCESRRCLDDAPAPCADGRDGVASHGAPEQAQRRVPPQPSHGV